MISWYETMEKAHSSPKKRLQQHNQPNHRPREQDYQMQSFYRTQILRNNENTPVSGVPLVVLNNSLLQIVFKTVCTEGTRTFLLLRWIVQIINNYFWKKNKIYWGRRRRVLQARHWQRHTTHLMALFWSWTVPLLLLTHQAYPLYPPNSQLQSH